MAAPEATATSEAPAEAGSEDREFVTALARGLRVLQVFGREQPELTLSEVAKAAGLAPGTARRCLFTLGCLGYVGTAGKRFFLMPKVVSLGAAYLDAAHIDDVVLPHLREFVATLGDSSTLAVLDGGYTMHVASYSAKRLIRLTVGTGTRFAAHATSTGRVLLGELPPEQLDAELALVERRAYTPRTVTDIDTLRRLVLQAREAGYSRVVDQLEIGLTSVAVPVRVDGEVVASLNSSTFFASEEGEAAFAHRLLLLRETAARIAESVRRVPALRHSLVPQSRRPR